METDIFRVTSITFLKISFCLLCIFFHFFTSVLPSINLMKFTLFSMFFLPLTWKLQSVLCILLWPLNFYCKYLSKHFSSKVQCYSVFLGPSYTRHLSMASTYWILFISNNCSNFTSTVKKLFEYTYNMCTIGLIFLKWTIKHTV